MTCYRFRNRTGEARPYGDRNGTKEGALIGSKHPAWRGDAARPETKRSRAQRQFKLGSCELCQKAATDRHHKDGDTGNNSKRNVQMLCRRCHMEADGRLPKFLSTCLGMKRRLLAYECKVTA